jgi:hypothetical protein
VQPHPVGAQPFLRDTLLTRALIREPTSSLEIACIQLEPEPASLVEALIQIGQHTRERSGSR